MGDHAGVAIVARRRPHVAQRKHSQHLVRRRDVTRDVWSDRRGDLAGDCAGRGRGRGWCRASRACGRSTPALCADGRLVVDVRPDTDVLPIRRRHSRIRRELFAACGRRRGDAKVGAGAAFPLRGDPVRALNVELDGEAVRSRIRFAAPRCGTPRPAITRPLASSWSPAVRSPATIAQTSERVAVVNRAFVRQYYPNRDPLTGAFFYGYPQVDRKTMTRIVGVVDDVRFKSLAQADESAYYLPFAQMGFPILRPPSSSPHRWKCLRHSWRRSVTH